MFVGALYGELETGKKGAFERHLSGCTECSREFGQLRSVAATMNERQRREMTPTEWTIFWNELSAKAPEDSRRSGIGLADRIIMMFRMRPVLRYGLAAVPLVLLGIMIGKIAFTGANDLEVQSLSRRLSDTERILLNERAQNYLQRSKILLLGIMNTSTVTPSSMTKEQELSRSLVREASDLRTELTGADQQQMRKLVDDLQVILLEIANLEQQKDYPGMEIVRDGVERSGLLLKINLEQMNAPTAAPVPAPRARHQSDSGT